MNRIKLFASLSVAGLAVIYSVNGAPKALAEKQSAWQIDNRLTAISEPVSVSLTSTMCDYEVWMADLSNLQTEFVIYAEFADGHFGEVHQIDWSGSVDHGGLVDRGVSTFGTWWGAYQHAENLIDEGKITYY
ncbi:MAG: hypothetical protein KDA96_21310, partial [Planctomycetaceae bacterium]|nr:hypothetical protein [Planctomycetaceae bacterium]